MKAFTIISTIFFALTATAAPAAEVESELAFDSFSLGSPSLPFGKKAIPLFDLATSFPPPLIPDTLAIESIRNTLALYAFAIDGKNFNALGEVFTNNVYANYSAPFPVFTNLQQLISQIGPSLQCVTTQHTYGTQLISVRSLTTAVSVTYFRAAHFGRNKLANQVAEAYAQYQDTWQRQLNGKWKIVQRNFVYMVCSQLLWILSPIASY